MSVDPERFYAMESKGLCMTVRKRMIGAVLVAVLGLGLVLVGSLPGPPPGETTGVGTPVVVLAVESLRADRLPCYGYTRNTMPAICSLAEDGVVFEEAYSHGSWDPPALPALLTGRLPVVVSPVRIEDPMARSVPGMADVLAAKGYAPVFARRYPNQVVGDGFTVRETRLPENIGRGMFLFWFLQETHYPYVPAPGYRRWSGVSNTTYQRLEQEAAQGWEQVDLAGLYEQIGRDAYGALYDETLREADTRVGMFLERLQERGLYRDALIVVTGDHGERLGTYGLKHAGWPDRATTHVPLIVKFPGNRYAGERVEHRVRHVDVAPTVYDVLGVDAPSMDGRSLLPLLREGGRDRAVFAAQSPFGQWVMRTGPHAYYVDTPLGLCSGGNRGAALYRADALPGNRTDMIGEDSERADAYRERFCTVYEQARADRAPELQDAVP